MGCDLTNNSLAYSLLQIGQRQTQGPNNLRVVALRFEAWVWTQLIYRQHTCIIVRIIIRPLIKTTRERENLSPSLVLLAKSLRCSNVMHGMSLLWMVWGRLSLTCQHQPWCAARYDGASHTFSNVDWMGIAFKNAKLSNCLNSAPSSSTGRSFFMRHSLKGFTCRQRMVPRLAGYAEITSVCQIGGFCCTFPLQLVLGSVTVT